MKVMLSYITRGNALISLTTLVFVVILCFEYTCYYYQTYSMHFVRIEGDLEAFEKVQKMYMQKVAQNAQLDLLFRSVYWMPAQLL